MSRYAVYFAPETGSHWWQAGCRWLGRDPASGQAVTQTGISGISPQRFHALTQDARRYGFHATLKAPFRLPTEQNPAALAQALGEFCSRQPPLAVPSPRPSWLGQFLALCPDGDQRALQALAQQCVSQFDRFRAAPDAAELARRQTADLTPRQAELLHCWGYPYTEEQFRFHMTLTAPVSDGQEREHLMQAASAAFQTDLPLVNDRIALFCEPEPGAPFQLLRNFLFGA